MKLLSRYFLLSLGFSGIMVAADHPVQLPPEFSAYVQYNNHLAALKCSGDPSLNPNIAHKPPIETLDQICPMMLRAFSIEICDLGALPTLVSDIQDVLGSYSLDVEVGPKNPARLPHYAMRGTIGYFLGMSDHSASAGLTLLIKAGWNAFKGDSKIRKAYRNLDELIKIHADIRDFLTKGLPEGSRESLSYLDLVLSHFIPHAKDGLKKRSPINRTEALWTAAAEATGFVVGTLHKKALQ